MNAKASPHFTVIPLCAARNPNFEIRTALPGAESQSRPHRQARHRRDLSSIARGNEVEQPAELVILSAYGLHNVHLMLLSGIGKPYDPRRQHRRRSGAITPTRSAAAPRCSSTNKTWFHPYMGAGAVGMAIDDFNAGNFDHRQGRLHRRRHDFQHARSARGRSTFTRHPPARRAGAVPGSTR